MNIIKNIISLSFAGVMAIATAGCSSEEPHGDPVARPIGLYTTADNISRAEAPMETDYHMWVSSLYHFNNSGFYYLKDQEFTCDNGDGLWYCKGQAFYPFEGSLDFVGYASKDPSHKPTTTYTPSTGLTGLGDMSYISDISLDYTGIDNMLDGKDDILASAIVENIECGGDNNDGRVVGLHFFHLLSCVRFTFTAQTEEASQFLWVTGIKLDKAKLSGVASLHRDRGGEWNVSWPVYTAPSTTSQDTNVSPSFNSTTLPNLDFFLPPQAVKDIVFTVYYKYRIEQNIYTNEMVFAVKKFGTPQSWEMGKRYNYNIKFNMLPHVEFQVSYEDEHGVVLDDWIQEEIEL